MTDSKAAADFIRKLRKKYAVLPAAKGRCKVIGTDGTPVIIPGPGHKVSARALMNARAELRRHGIYP